MRTSVSESAAHRTNPCMKQLSCKLESPAGEQPHLVHQSASTGSMDTSASSLIPYEQPIGKASAVEAWGPHVEMPSQIVNGSQGQQPYVIQAANRQSIKQLKHGGPTW